MIWWIHGVYSLTIKTIYLSDLSALMVPPEKSDFIRKACLQGEELSECFQTVITSVHKIALQESRDLHFETRLLCCHKHAKKIAVDPQAPLYCLQYSIRRQLLATDVGILDIQPNLLMTRSIS